MNETRFMAWLRRRCGVKTFDEDVDEKIKQKETLKKWREKTIQQWSTVHETDDEVSPYNTYFFNYCQYCSRFKPSACFDQDGFVFIKSQSECSKFRIGNIMLQEEFERRQSTEEVKDNGNRS